jgi:hypothetical protein
MATLAAKIRHIFGTMGRWCRGDWQPDFPSFFDAANDIVATL